MQEVTPERKWAGSITGEGGFMVITLTLIYPVAYICFFPTFFLGNVDKEKFFYDILEQKKPFLGYKNKKFYKSENWHFSKWGNPWFWSRNSYFSYFFF